MAKASLEIRKAKTSLEETISTALYLAINLWQDEYPDWMVTDADLGIIDVSVRGEQRRIPATAIVEITKKDLTMKITKHGKVKEIE